MNPTSPRRSGFSRLKRKIRAFSVRRTENDPTILCGFPRHVVKSVLPKRNHAVKLVAVYDDRTDSHAVTQQAMIAVVTRRLHVLTWSGCFANDRKSDVGLHSAGIVSGLPDHPEVTWFLPAVARRTLPGSRLPAPKMLSRISRGLFSERRRSRFLGLDGCSGTEVLIVQPNTGATTD